MDEQRVGKQLHRYRGRIVALETALREVIAAADCDHNEQHYIEIRRDVIEKARVALERREYVGER